MKKILVTFRQKVGLPNKVRIRKGTNRKSPSANIPQQQTVTLDRSPQYELEKVQVAKPPHDLEKVLGELEKVQTAT